MDNKSERIAKLLRKGLTVEQIAKKTGMTVDAVTNRIAWLNRGVSS